MRLLFFALLSKHVRQIYSFLALWVGDREWWSSVPFTSQMSLAYIYRMHVYLCVCCVGSTAQPCKNRASRHYSRVYWALQLSYRSGRNVKRFHVSLDCSMGSTSNYEAFYSMKLFALWSFHGIFTFVRIWFRFCFRLLRCVVSLLESVTHLVTLSKDVCVFFVLIYVWTGVMRKGFWFFFLQIQIFGQWI